MRLYVEDFVRSREEDRKLEDVGKLFRVFQGMSSSGRPVGSIRTIFHYCLEQGIPQKIFPGLTVPEMRAYLEAYLYSLGRRP